MRRHPPPQQRSAWLTVAILLALLALGAALARALCGLRRRGPDDRERFSSGDVAAALRAMVPARSPAEADAESDSEAAEGAPDADGADAEESSSEPGAPGVDIPRIRMRVLQTMRTSVHEQVEVVDTGDVRLGKCLRIDGRVQLCERDEHRYHEMLVHFPAQYLVDAAPRRALIVGGGDLMALREVMKYGPAVKHVVVVEPDERLPDFCENQFQTVRRHERDPRVHFMFGDVMASLTRLQAQRTNLGAFDLVVVDTKERAILPEDLTEFGRALRTLMARQGVMVVAGQEAHRRALGKLLPFSLEVSFTSVAQDAKVRLALLAQFNLARRSVNPSRLRERYRIRTRFYDPTRHGSYVPWFAAARVTAAATGLAGSLSAAF